MTERSEPGKWLTYATVTSTVALVLSLFSFYFTWLYEKHSLTSGIVAAGPNDVALPFTFQSDLVIRNTGNRTETLLTAGLWCVPVDEQGGGLWDPKQVRGPQVLRAGDAVPLRLELAIDYGDLENCAKWSGSNGEKDAMARFEIRMSAVSPDGLEVKHVVPVGRITFHEASGEVKFSKPPTAIAWQELLR